METPTHPKKNQSFSKEPVITQECKEEERNEVWGSICFQKKKKGGRKRKRERAENAIEKKAYRDKFYFVA